MEDKLKKHIESNRDEFEFYETNFDLLWKGIEGNLDDKVQKKKSRFLKYTLRIAASVLIIMSISIAFKIGQESASIKKNGLALHDISSEMAETESYYSGLIDEKMEYIKANSDHINPETWQILKQLDEDYDQLKIDLNDQAGSEEVIEAMIRYYRLKLEMLEQISGELKDKNQSDEDVNI